MKGLVQNVAPYCLTLSKIVFEVEACNPSFKKGDSHGKTIKEDIFFLREGHCV